MARSLRSISPLQTATRTCPTPCTTGPSAQRVRSKIMCMFSITLLTRACERSERWSAPRAVAAGASCQTTTSRRSARSGASSRLRRRRADPGCDGIARAPLGIEKCLRCTGAACVSGWGGVGCGGGGLKSARRSASVWLRCALPERAGLALLQPKRAGGRPERRGRRGRARRVHAGAGLG